MEKSLDFLDLSCCRWVFLWDKEEEKVLHTGKEALEAWQWYRREGKTQRWQLAFPFRAGILQSSWALNKSLAHFFGQQKKRTRSIKPLNLLVASANTPLEKQKIQQLVQQNSLRPVKLIDRADFFADYLNRTKNFSKLKLIIDLNQDFIELSLFLETNRLKTKHLALGDFLEDQDLMDKLKLVLDAFLLNLPRDLFAQKWQYFYIFMSPALKQKIDIDDFNRHLQMEAIVNQQQLKDYVKSI